MGIRPTTPAPIWKTLFLLFSVPGILTMSIAGLVGQSFRISTYGGLLPQSGAPALTQAIGVPEGVCSDGEGGLYVASITHNRVYRVDAAGTLTVVAGNGASGYGGDGGPASEAQLNQVHAIARDRSGDLFIADTGNNRIRKVSSDGVISTVAGTGAWGFAGDGGPSTSARLATPRGVAVDAAGNLVIADSGNHRIRMVTTEGIIYTVAGTGRQGFRGDDGPAIAAELSYPVAVATHVSGYLFIVDRYNNRIRRVTPEGIIRTIAGDRDSIALWDPRGVDVDRAGNAFIADSGNNRILRLDTGGQISTVAGSGAGFGGDGEPAMLAKLALPVALAVDEGGSLFIADRGNYRVRRVTSDGIINSVTGTTGDGGPAVLAQFNYPNSIASDAAGNLFVADTDGQRIRKIAADGMLNTVAGNGAAGFGGDDGPATSALLNYPSGVAADGVGNLLIADTKNQRIRRVTPDGLITTIAGTGASGFGSDGGPARLSRLNEPCAVAADRAGNVYVADTSNHRIRKIDLDGTITTLAGDGARGFGGDHGPAIFSQLHSPQGVAVDSAGNVFIADSQNHRIRVVTTDGLIRTIAGTGTEGFAGDGGPATAAQLAYPVGVAIGRDGQLLIADTSNKRVRVVGPDGIITTLAGNGRFGSDGDGGLAWDAQLTYPFGVTFTLDTIYVTDTFSSRIRRIE